MDCWREKKIVEMSLAKGSQSTDNAEDEVQKIVPLLFTSVTPVELNFPDNDSENLIELLPFPKDHILCNCDEETVPNVLLKSTSADEPMLSTSTAYLTISANSQEGDFSSDDSVHDPHYTPNNEEHSSSTSRGEENPVPAPLPSNLLPKSSIRVLKREKKTKRNLGQSYKTLQGKVISGRALRELSTCRMKCKERVSLNDRQAIFTEYWKMGSYVKRSAYMASLMEIEDKATQRIRALDPEKQKFRMKTYRYFLPIHGKREPVCRGCLLKILDESDNFIRTVSLKKRASIGGTETDDMRGKVVPKNKVSDLKREEIKAHIMSFPAYESHYTRKTTTKKYLPSHLTMQKMYSLFCENNENPPSIKIYSQEFHKLKLSFKKATCGHLFHM